MEHTKRIRSWARYYEPDEARLDFVKADFWSAGNNSNKRFIQRLHKMMEVEMQFWESLETVCLKALVEGEFGENARDFLRQQDKIRRQYEGAKMLGRVLEIAGTTVVSTHGLPRDATLLAGVGSALGPPDNWELLSILKALNYTSVFSYELATRIENTVGPIEVELDDRVYSASSGDLKTMRQRLKKIYNAGN